MTKTPYKTIKGVRYSKERVYWNLSQRGTNLSLVLHRRLYKHTPDANERSDTTYPRKGQSL